MNSQLGLISVRCHDHIWEPDECISTSSKEISGPTPWPLLWSRSWWCSYSLMVERTWPTAWDYTPFILKMIMMMIIIIELTCFAWFFIPFQAHRREQGCNSLLSQMIVEVYAAIWEDSLWLVYLIARKIVQFFHILL